MTPDTKDWTWVVSKPCPECGLDAATVEYDDIPRRITDNAEQWVEVLTADNLAKEETRQLFDPKLQVKRKIELPK